MKKYIFYIAMINLLLPLNSLLPMDRSSDSDEDQTAHQARKSRKQKEFEQMKAQDKAIEEAQEFERNNRLTEKNDDDIQARRSTASAAAAHSSQHPSKEQSETVSTAEIRKLDVHLQSIAVQVNNLQDDMLARFEKQERVLAEIKALLTIPDIHEPVDNSIKQAKD